MVNPWLQCSHVRPFIGAYFMTPQKSISFSQRFILFLFVTSTVYQQEKECKPLFPQWEQYFLYIPMGCWLYHSRIYWHWSVLYVSACEFNFKIFPSLSLQPHSCPYCWLIVVDPGSSQTTQCSLAWCHCCFQSRIRVRSCLARCFDLPSISWQQHRIRVLT